MYQPVQKVIVIGVPRHDQSAFEVYWSLLFHCHVTRHPGYKQGAIALGRINMTNHTDTIRNKQVAILNQLGCWQAKGHQAIGMVHPCIWHHKLGNLGD
jgi:hypothetical protein